MKRILVIDDDVTMCDLLVDYFRTEGIVCEYAHAGDEGLRLLKGGGFDIVILDIMLPGKDGFDILRDIRGRSDIPVLMLTARGDHIDRVVGLELGADDYICKPFNSRELTARVRAVLRRVGDADEEPTPDSEILRVDDLEMDTRARTVTVEGNLVILTAIEFKLLKVLLTNVGKLVSIEGLAPQVLNRKYKIGDRSISVHMSNLRRKIGNYPSGNERILTIRGEGFIYARAKQQTIIE